MNTNETVLVTGATGLVGSAIVRALKAQGFTDVWDASRKAVDFENRDATEWYFEEVKPAYVFHCAAKVGGIADNINGPASFLMTNLEIQMNVLRAAHDFGVRKLLFLSSAACYPENAESPLVTGDLMTGPFDETKSGYAMAKLAGMQMCKEFRKQFGSCFITAIPNNVYGPGDRSSHVIPSMIRRFHDAKIQGADSVTCWGTGNARREFIFSEDLASACLFLMDSYSLETPVNVGTRKDWVMKELALLVASVVGFKGAILWDENKPEGVRSRLLDSRVLRELGWCPKVSLLDGLARTYKGYNEL